MELTCQCRKQMRSRTKIIHKRHNSCRFVCTLGLHIRKGSSAVVTSVLHRQSFSSFWPPSCLENLLLRCIQDGKRTFEVLCKYCCVVKGHLPRGVCSSGARICVEHGSWRLHQMTPWPKLTAVKMVFLLTRMRDLVLTISNCL